MSSSERSPVQVVPDVQMLPRCATRWLACPTTMFVVPPFQSGDASEITSTYVFQWLDVAQASDWPCAQSVLPMYATAMCPFAPAVTSGNAVEWSDDGLSWVCGVQYVPGRPPTFGLFRGSLI